MELRLAAVGNDKDEEEDGKEEDDDSTPLSSSSSSHTLSVKRGEGGRNHTTTRTRPITGPDVGEDR